MKVLIIDDHTLVRDGLSLLLPALDPEFISVGAASCEDAFAILEQQPDIGLVLVDLGLPGMSGDDAVVAIRGQFPEVPIVALSGTQDRATVLACIRSGAMGFIPKTYSGDRLLGALRFILVHKGTFLPAELMLDNLVARHNNATGAPQANASVGSVTVTPQSIGLTDRQADVLHLLLQGKPNKVIGRELNIESTTVRAHVTAVLRALNVTTRTEAVIAAHRLQLVFGKR